MVKVRRGKPRLGVPKRGSLRKDLSRSARKNPTKWGVVDSEGEIYCSGYPKQKAMLHAARRAGKGRYPSIDELYIQNFDTGEKIPAEAA